MIRAPLATVLSMAFLLLLASCATPPAPLAPSAAEERAAALVQGGLDAGEPPPASEATQAEPSVAEAAPIPEDAPAVAVAPAPTKAAPTVIEAPEEPMGPPPSQLTAEESAWLQNHLNRLKYMVYYNEGAGVDPKVARIAVAQANRYLIEKLGLAVVDYDQVEKNKKDQAAAWQAETGESIGIVQYLAQKFDADVYVEIDFTIVGDGKDGKYSAAAQGAMKIFETSTATLLGSVSLASQAAFSPTSLAAASSNAIQASVWNLMPKVTSQAKTLLGNSLSRGIRYELILRKTPDARALSTFRRALSRQLREVVQVSYTPEETRLDVYGFVSKDRVEEAVYLAADQSGFRDIFLASMRGRSFTFDSGS